MQRALRVLALSCSALSASCGQLDDLSLGALEQDAAMEREAREAPPAPSVDATQPAAPLERDAGTAKPPAEDDDDARDTPRDAGGLAEAGSVSDAAAPLDSSVDASSDAGSSSDARAAEAGSDAALDEDASPADAGSDAARSLLCTFEPWHCL